MITHHTFDVAATLAFWFLAFIWTTKGNTGISMAFNWILKLSFITLALAGSWFLLFEALAQTKFGIR